MSFYNTGNPVPSIDPRDLDDNAKKLDEAINSQEETWVDRLGSTRKSIKGVENGLAVMQEGFDEFIDTSEAEFNEFLLDSGYETPVDYTPGISITRSTQIVRYLSELYRPKIASLPFITTTFAADSAKWIANGDNSLRQELANPDDQLKGAGMSGWTRSDPTSYSPEVYRVKRMLDAQALSVWGEFSHLVTDRPDPDNYTTWDWYPALQAAANKAFSTITMLGVYCSNVHHSGIVLDLGGFSFRTKQPITTPVGGGVTVLNGTIFADATFPTNRYLWELGIGTSVFRHENVTFDRVTLDARHRGGCLLVQNSIRTRVLGCAFMRYGNGLHGVRTGPSGGVYETLIDTCTFGYALYGNTTLDTGAAGTGYGVYLNSTDNRVLNSIFYTRGGIYCGSQAQRISGCQFYGTSNDIAFPAIEIRSSSINVTGCDFGKRSIHVYSPFNIIISGNNWVMETTAADDYAISLIPTGAGETMAGVVITGNCMHRVSGVKCLSIKYDTSLGAIARVKGSHIGENVYYGVFSVATSATKNMFVTSGQTATFDFTDIIPFGVVASIQMSYANQLHATAVVPINLAGNISAATRSSVPLKISAASTGNFICTISVEELPD